MDVREKCNQEFMDRAKEYIEISTCLFVLNMILLVYVLIRLEGWCICEETAMKQRGKY